MNENKINKKSIPIFIVCSPIFLIVSLFLKDGSYLGGFILGYVIGVIVFTIIIKSINAILDLRGRSVFIIIVMGILKLGFYALGFILAVKIPSLFNLFSVCIGYFIIKITIYFEAYRNRGGDLHG